MDKEIERAFLETISKALVSLPFDLKVLLEAVSDLDLDEAGLRDLAAHLKGRCGTGGTVRDGCIEIQGDLRERVAAELEQLGYRVKRVGG